MGYGTHLNFVSYLMLIMLTNKLWELISDVGFYKILVTILWQMPGPLDRL